MRERRPDQPGGATTGHGTTIHPITTTTLRSSPSLYRAIVASLPHFSLLLLLLLLTSRPLPAFSSSSPTVASCIVHRRVCVCVCELSSAFTPLSLLFSSSLPLPSVPHQFIFPIEILPFDETSSPLPCDSLDEPRGLATPSTLTDPTSPLLCSVCFNCSRLIPGPLIVSQ